MAGIGFAGQAHTWNKDNLSQVDRRAGFNRRQVSTRGTKITYPKWIGEQVLTGGRRIMTNVLMCWFARNRRKKNCAYFVRHLISNESANGSKSVFYGLFLHCLV